MPDYGEGLYIEGDRKLKGRIVIEGNRLYLSGIYGASTTYIPLEKIERLRYVRGGLEIKVKLSAANIVRAVISLPAKDIQRLTKDLVKRLHLKKRFLKREWSGEAAWR